MATALFDAISKPLDALSRSWNVFGFILKANEYDEMENWCIENSFDRWKWLEWIKPIENHYTYRQICFENIEDAMAFKLRWI